MRARWMFLILLAVPGLLSAAGRTASLTEPKGFISETSPTFRWQTVSSAVSYDLYVVSSKGLRIAESVAPSECAAESCSFVSTASLEPGPHFWLVLSRIAGDRDIWSNPKRFTVAPDGKPGVVELLDPEGTLDTTTPTFTWKPAAGIGPFDYIVDVMGGSPKIFFRDVFAGADLCTADVCTLPHDVSGLTLADGKYSWRVRAASVVGRGPRSDLRRFDVRTLPVPPARPSAIAPRGRTSETSPRFVWTKADGATEYLLEIKNRATGDVVSGSYVEDAALCPDTTCGVTPAGLVLDHGRYDFAVTAKNSAGLGRPSRRARFRVGDYLGTPVLVAPEGKTGVTPTFEWLPVADATYYLLQVKNGDGRVSYTRHDAADVCGASMCRAELGITLPEGEYRWRALARSNVKRRGNPSAWMVFEAVDGGGTVPGIPELVSPNGTTDQKTPTFVWHSVPTATSYRLTVKDAFDPVLYSHTYTNTEASCSDTCSVTPAESLDDADYSFVVEAINAAGPGAPSPAMTFTVEAGGGRPGIPEIVAPLGTERVSTPTFTWRPVAGATSYVLNVSDAAGPSLYTLELRSADVCAAECTVTPTEDLADGDYAFFLNAKAGTVSGDPARGEFKVDTSATPPATTPLTPAGTTAERNPAFTWTVVTEAVAYTLIVVDSGGVELHNLRYELAALTCSATDCSATPALDLPDGAYSFNVTSENAAGMTTPSAPLGFTVSATPSTLRVTSHTEGETVTDNGLVLAGTIDGATASLTVQLDIDGATVMPARGVEISSTNVWNVFVLPGELSPGAATLTFASTDSGGAVSTLTFDLTVTSFDIKESMLLTRATLGATPALLDEIRSGGIVAFQDRLLAPTPDPGFDAFIASLPTSSEGDMREYSLLHAIYNPNALEEVMAQFWENHFSTYFHSHNVPEYELREHDAFRANAFGRFRDLVGISAKSPAMLHYLDLTSNSVTEPNENYPRELLELSTMGVDGGYTDEDIEELARILTGWKEVGDNFAFVDSDHDFGTKTFLGTSFPTPAGAGLAEGEAVLDILSAHRSTAEFICTKLARVLITESPGAGLVAGCADVFQSEHASGNPNQMRDVVRFLLDSPEFSDPANFKAKVKTPLEHLASVVRNMDMTIVDHGEVESELRQLGQELFHRRSPDGYSETADDWVDTSLLLARVDFVNEVGRRTVADDTFVDIRAYFLDKGLETSEGVIGYLFDIAFQNEFTILELNMAHDILSGGGVSQFDIHDVSEAEARLRRLVSTVLSFSGYQHQ